MSKLYWGKVFFKDCFAGVLHEMPGDSFCFEYDESYLAAGHPALSFTLPLSQAKHISHRGLHPFFDNLVAEGWLENAQNRLLGYRKFSRLSRFELLLAFGYDCIGAVSVIDPEPAKISDQLMNREDPKELAVLTSRASLSGVQPKLAVVEKSGQFFPALPQEVSSHIAKFPSPHHADLIWNEYLTTEALKILLPDDEVVDLSIGTLQGQTEPALLIKRFDRVRTADKQLSRIHFEEFNSLLSKQSSEKYDGAYADMSAFIRQQACCLATENYRLFKRILAGLLLGNTDMHFKNFSLFHGDTGLGWRLTPCYDMVSANLYEYKFLALSLAGATNLKLSDLKTKHLVKLTEEFGLDSALLALAVNEFEKNIPKAFTRIEQLTLPSSSFNKQLIIQQVEKRWNQCFQLIGRHLSKKRLNEGKPKS